MAWSTSHRKDELPPNWAALRKQAKARAGDVCEFRDKAGVRCADKGSELHHTGRKFDHRLEVLMWICTPHHAGETARQAKAAQYAKYVAAKKRPTEQHPGIRGAAATDKAIARRLHR